MEKIKIRQNKGIKMKKIITLLLCLVFGSALAAQTPNPMSTLQPISNKMLSALKANSSRLKSDPNLVYRLVDRIVVPYVDVVGMSRSVLGRNAWRSASSRQQQAFTKAFKRVVINTYSSALNAYSDESIRFYPIRGGYAGKTRVQVFSQVVRNSGPAVPVSYRMILMKGKWKVYDLNVEGVSLLQSFHAQFADQLSQGKTVSQITNNLNSRRKSR